MARKPDYDLSLMDKKSGRKNPNAGGAWLNDDGSINIQVNPFINITDNPDMVITLFPRNSPPVDRDAADMIARRPRSSVVDDPYGPPWRKE
jgi:hypothetical protein